MTETVVAEAVNLENEEAPVEQTTNGNHQPGIVPDPLHPDASDYCCP